MCPGHGHKSRHALGQAGQQATCQPVMCEDSGDDVLQSRDAPEIAAGYNTSTGGNTSNMLGSDVAPAEVAVAVATSPAVVAAASSATVTAQMSVDVMPTGHQGTCLQPREVTSSGTDVSAEICGPASAHKYISQSDAHSAVSELYSLDGGQRAICEGSAAETVSPEPGLPDQLKTEWSQNSHLDPVSSLLDDEDKGTSRSADPNIKLGLGHRGIYHKMRQFSTVSLQCSSVFEANGGCAKIFVEIFRSRSLQESVTKEPSICDFIFFMDQHSGLLNSILREYWRIKWK